MIRALTVMACIAGTGCLGGDESNTTEPGCGDGMVDVLHESCDDGNIQSGDGCSSTCLAEAAVTVHWKIQNNAGVPQPCPVGFDLVEVTKMTLRFTAAPIWFRCADGEGHLEWLEVPRSPASALQLRLASSTSPEVSSETTVSLSSSGGARFDDVTGTLITDPGQLGL